MLSAAATRTVMPDADLRVRLAAAERLSLHAAQRDAARHGATVSAWPPPQLMAYYRAQRVLVTRAQACVRRRAARRVYARMILAQLEAEENDDLVLQQAVLGDLDRQARQRSHDDAVVLDRMQRIASSTQ